MNGMKAKKERKDHAKRFTEGGISKDDKDWTVEDWRDLWYGMQAIRAKISKRHQKLKEEPQDE